MEEAAADERAAAGAGAAAAGEWPAAAASAGEEMDGHYRSEEGLRGSRSVDEEEQIERSFSVVPVQESR